MSQNRFASRRRVLKGFLAAVSALFGSAGGAGAGSYLERGIGGTGGPSSPNAKEDDRGIGGTGVIGTIQRFGSIVVNDLRIGYPEDVVVSLDGAPAKASDLKIGHVVRVVAHRQGEGLATRKIEVASEVIGRIDAVSLGGFSVLGQKVSLADLGDGASQWRIGDHVAVSGLRKPDGTIVASLVQKRAGETMKVMGPVVAGPDGSAMVGGLKLSGADSALIGQRALLEGRMAGGVFQVSEATSERALLGPAVKSLVVEAYVERAGGGVKLGSGLQVAGNRGANNLPSGEVLRAIISAAYNSGGRLELQSVRLDPYQGSAKPSNGAKPSNSKDRGGMNEPDGTKGRANAEEPSGIRGFEDPWRSGVPGAPSGGAPTGFGGSTGPWGPGGLGGPGGGPGPGGFGGPPGASGPGGFGSTRSR